MRALVVYESLYGNTHEIADHVAEGLRRSFDVTVAHVDDVTPDLVGQAHLVVVGGPTHAHGMTSRMSRDGAVKAASNTPELPPLDEHAPGTGLRDWFVGLPDGHRTPAAAFDTRFDGPELVTGAASHGIARRLRKHGFDVVARPESFRVDKQTRLLPGEAERATAWAVNLSALVQPVA
jgi:Flavodoxin